MASIEFLRRRIGQSIANAFVATIGSGASFEVNSFVLAFREGKALSLGCAGDGGINCHKVAGPYDLGNLGLTNQWEPIPSLSGATLKSVDLAKEHVDIHTTVGRVRLNNVDDRLCVSISPS